MENKLLNNVVLCLILVSFLLLPAGCDDKSDMEPGISAFSCFNSDGDILAVLVGLKVKGWDRCALSETTPFLLKLNEKSLLKSYQQLDVWVFRDMAFRPAHDNQLYYVTFEKIFGSGGFYEHSSGRQFKWGAGKLVMYDADSDDNITTTISQNCYPNILSCFRWSPDGKTLAGLAIRPNSHILNRGEFTVSFDGGMTYESTGIEMLGYPAWLNDNELYLRTDDNTIVKVSRDGQKFKITEKLTKDFSIGLRGTFQEKLVYNASPRKDDKGKSPDKLTRVFVGDKLIYETDDPYTNAFVFKDRIVVEVKNKRLLIFDENLSMFHERRLGRKTDFLNIQPNTNIVFLVRDWKTILCYDYTKKEKPRILFSVDMLNDPPK